MDNKLIIVLMIVVCLSSCVGTKTLYKGLTKEQATLAYLYDTPQNFSVKGDTITVMNPVISDPRFNLPGYLYKVKASAVPLIIYTGWKSEHEYAIGKNVIKEDLSPFIRESIIAETNRSTILFADSTAGSDLTLEIEVDSVGARGPYRSDGYFLFLLLAYSYSFNESAGPGIAYSSMNYTLRKDNEILFSGRVSNYVETEPLINNFRTPNDLRKFFSSNLTEGLSQTLKANIEEIVREVEDYYVKNPPEMK